jgi:homogentisate 1,2-dioxygenase (EC 1.13.11.5)
MNKQTLISGMQQASTSVGTVAGYMPGFGNDFETEALPDALPQGMNSPQKGELRFVRGAAFWDRLYRAQSSE